MGATAALLAAAEAPPWLSLRRRRCRCCSSPATARARRCRRGLPARRAARMRGAAQRSSWRPAVAARAQRQRLAPLAAARGRCSLPTRQLDAPLLLLPLPLLQGLLAAVARWHLRPACLLEPRGGLWEAPPCEPARLLPASGDLGLWSVYGCCDERRALIAKHCFCQAQRRVLSNTSLKTSVIWVDIARLHPRRHRQPKRSH